MFKMAVSLPPPAMAPHRALAWWTQAWCQSASGMMSVGIRQLELANSWNGKALAMWEGLALAGIRRAPTRAGVAQPVPAETIAARIAERIEAARVAEPVAAERREPELAPKPVIVAAPAATVERAADAVVAPAAKPSPLLGMKKGRGKA